MSAKVSQPGHEAAPTPLVHKTERGGNSFPIAGLAVWEKASLHHEVEKLAVDLDGVAGASIREPLAPTSGISGTPLPKGGSFLNHGPFRLASVL